MSKLPNRLFFTGVPGSRWSGIAQIIETIPGFNISDRSVNPEYSHNGFSGHKGVYFGRSQDRAAQLDTDYLDSAWPDPRGCKLIKSHDWAYVLDDVWRFCRANGDWLMMVYRPDMSSYAWWHEAGGFNITHPRYDHYIDHAGMLAGIARENNCILEFGHRHNVTWNYFSKSWIKDNFNQDVELDKFWPDILVTLLK